MGKDMCSERLTKMQVCQLKQNYRCRLMPLSNQFLPSFELHIKKKLTNEDLELMWPLSLFPDLNKATLLLLQSQEPRNILPSSQVPVKYLANAQMKGKKTNPL